MYGTEEDKEPASPDVKKENLRHIMKVVDQLNADIKYSVDHENNLRTDINELRNAVKLKEDKIIQLSDERQALINAREGIFKAMKYLDPPETPDRPIDECGEYTDDDTVRRIRSFNEPD